jgi:hypothetical protein
MMNQYFFVVEDIDFHDQPFIRQTAQGEPPFSFRAATTASGVRPALESPRRSTLVRFRCPLPAGPSMTAKY